MFPVIHQPTFVFRDCPPPLLLNAIALGALFLGTTDANSKVSQARRYKKKGRTYTNSSRRMLSGSSLTLPSQHHGIQ